MATDERPIPSVWARPRRTRERPPLSREHIVSEAVLLLDAEGIDALSMRKLGGRLGAGATSLYRHVADKDELIELVVDEVFGEMGVLSREEFQDWRDAITMGGERAAAVFLWGHVLNRKLASQDCKHGSQFAGALWSTSAD